MNEQELAAAVAVAMKLRMGGGSTMAWNSLLKRVADLKKQTDDLVREVEAGHTTIVFTKLKTILAELVALKKLTGSRPPFADTNLIEKFRSLHVTPPATVNMESPNSRRRFATSLITFSQNLSIILSVIRDYARGVDVPE